MAFTYIALASATVGSGGASSIVFNSIPQTYTDLKIVLSTRTDYNGGGRDYTVFRINSSTSSYYRRWSAGYDSGQATSASSNESYAFLGATSDNQSTASVFGQNHIYIPNYATTRNKSFITEGYAANNSSITWMISMSAGILYSTSAITSITLYPAGGNTASPSGLFLQNSTAYLYGIKNS